MVQHMAVILLCYIRKTRLNQIKYNTAIDQPYIIERATKLCKTFCKIKNMKKTVPLFRDGQYKFFTNFCLEMVIQRDIRWWKSNGNKQWFDERHIGPQFDERKMKFWIWYLFDEIVATGKWAIFHQIQIWWQVWVTIGDGLNATMFFCSYNRGVSVASTDVKPTRHPLFREYQQRKNVLLFCR